MEFLHIENYQQFVKFFKEELGESVKHRSFYGGDDNLESSTFFDFSTKNWLCALKNSRMFDAVPERSLPFVALVEKMGSPHRLSLMA